MADGNDHVSLARAGVAVADDPPPGGRQRLAKRGHEERILAAALALLAEDGFHGTGMRQIAAAARVSTANVYNYFPAKADVLLRLLDRACRDQLAEVEDAVADAGEDVADQLRAAVSAYARFTAERRAESFIAASELRYLDGARREVLLVARDRVQAAVEDVVRRGAARGRFRTPHPDQATLAILSACNGIALWFSPAGPVAPGELAARFARYALALVEGPVPEVSA